MKTNLLPITAAAWLLATSAALADRPFDANGDNVIGQDEFMASPLQDDPRWDAWDSDADGSLSQEEVAEGVFARYDENGDGVWDAEEFAAYEEAEDWF